MSTLRLGTRGSELAIAQAKAVEQRLLTQDPSLDIDIVIIQTPGDQDTQTPLMQMGGKGVFVKGIEQALLDETIDMAVHSFKDMSCRLPEGLALPGVFSKERTEDVWLSRDGTGIDSIAKGAVIGTGSPRRQALIKRRRPDLKCQSIRGNVQTRIAKLDAGDYDAIILSAAGLERLGLGDRATEYLDKHEFCIAPGQGVIAIETRAADTRTFELAQAISDPEQSQKTAWDLQVLQGLAADCNVPLGFAYSAHKETEGRYTLFLANTAGTKYWEKEASLATDAITEALAQDIPVAAAWMAANG